MRKLWQYYRYEPVLTNAGAVANFSSGNIDSASLTSKLVDGGTKNVEIMVPLKYLINFWETLEMLLVNCEINLILTLV